MGLGSHAVLSHPTSSSFSPSSLSPALWIDPSDASTVTISGSSGAYIGPLGLTIASSASVANGASAPWAAYMDVAADLDIAMRIKLGNVPPSAWSTILSRWESVQQSFLLDYKDTGVLNATIRVGGSNVTYNSTATIGSAGYVTGDTMWLRLYRKSSTGDVKYYTAADSTSVPSSWTQLGATVAGTSGAITASYAAFYIGYNGGGLTGPKYPCTHKRTVLYSGDLTAGGSIIFDADFVGATDYADSFTESSSNAATVTVTSSTSGALVSQINDQSGNSRHLTQATAAKMPKFVYDTTAGKTVLVFDGTDDYMDCATNVLGVNSVSLVAAVKVTANQAGGIITSKQSGVEDSVALDIEGSGVATLYTGVTNTSATAASLNGSWASVIGTVSTRVPTIYRDGSASAAGSASGSLNPAATNRVGTYRVEASNYAAMRLGEMFVCQAVWSGTDITNVQGYIKPKWGTP